MPDDLDDELMPILLGTNALADGEVREFNTFEEAMVAIKNSLEPGGVVDIHSEDCQMTAGGGEDSCTCTPLRLVGGARA